MVLENSFDLADDITADPIVIAYLEDIKIARQFYAALCNMRWEKIIIIPEDEQIINKLKGIDPFIWSCSWRSAGAIIASIRTKHYAVHEDYMTFYSSGDEGYVSALVSECFERMGWKQCPWKHDII